MRAKLAILMILATTSVSHALDRSIFAPCRVQASDQLALTDAFLAEGWVPVDPGPESDRAVQAYLELRNASSFNDPPFATAQEQTNFVKSMVRQMGEYQLHKSFLFRDGMYMAPMWGSPRTQDCIVFAPDIPSVDEMIAKDPLRPPGTQALEVAWEWNNNVGDFERVLWQWARLDAPFDTDPAPSRMDTVLYSVSFK